MSEDLEDESAPGSLNPAPAPRASLKALAAIAVVASILAVAAAGIYLGRDSLWPPAVPAMPATMSEYNTTHLSIPASSVGANAAFFTYNSSGTQVRLFVVKDQNGTVHAAFDACPECFASGLGFHQQGDMMFDNRTNRSIPISAIGTDTFGCHPVGLSCRIEGGRVMIPKAAVLSGAYLFRTPAGIGAVENFNLTTIAIPLASLGGTPAWYEYNLSGARVRFIAALDGTGAVHTAFDECPMCYESHQGFRWEGNMLVENCCDMPFSVNAIAPGLTGCHPEYLPSHVEGDKVIVLKSDLLAKAFMFRPECGPGVVADHNLTTVAIPLSSVGANATWYDYTVSGAMVRFFIVTSPNGTVHAALDNCPKCYKKHAGFRQEGAVMVENCCNMPFSIDNITASGCNRTGCHPAFLPTIMDGPRILILVADLEAGRYLFQ